MPIKNVGTATANSLTIKQAGVYEINYMFNASSSLGGAVSLSVRKNGTAITSTRETHLLAIGIESIFSGSVLEVLAAGDVLAMAVSALLALNLTLGSGVSVTLTVKKLDPAPEEDD